MTSRRIAPTPASKRQMDALRLSSGGVQHVPPDLHICLLVSTSDLFYACFYIGITVEGANLSLCLENEVPAPPGPNLLCHMNHLHTGVSFEKAFCIPVIVAPAAGYSDIVPFESRYVIKHAHLHSLWC